jgi:ribosomal protein L24
MNQLAKLDYGDAVQVTQGEYAGRTGVVVGMHDSGLTFTIEFGDGTDAEVAKTSLQGLPDVVS